jgi:hypothetical protein
MSKKLSKGRKNVEQVAQTETTAVEQTAAPAVAVAVPNPTIAVKGGQKYRGARAAWYERLMKYDGKPLAEFIADVTADRPSKYGARSTHAGEPEPVQGWVRYFERTGVMELK